MKPDPYGIRFLFITKILRKKLYIILMNRLIVMNRLIDSESMRDPRVLTEHLSKAYQDSLDGCVRNWALCIGINCSSQSCTYCKLNDFYRDSATSSNVDWNKVLNFLALRKLQEIVG